MADVKSILTEKKRSYVLALVGFVFLSSIYFAHVAPPFLVSLISLLMIYLALAESWGFLYAYLGEFSFGHIVFFGIGAYGVAFLNLGNIFLNPALNLLVAGVAAVVAAAIIAYPMLRIRGWYFALGTAAFLVIIRTVVLANPGDITKGALGIFINVPAASQPLLYVSGLAMGFGSVALVRFIIDSKFGLALKCIRDSYEAATMIGLAPVLYRIAAFLIAAFLAGLAGGYLSMYNAYIEPGAAFDPNLNFLLLVMAILGGSAEPVGPFIGATMVLVLEEIGQIYFLRGYLLLLAVILIPIMILMPGGVMGSITHRTPIQNPFARRGKRQPVGTS